MVGWCRFLFGGQVGWLGLVDRWEGWGEWVGWCWFLLSEQMGGLGLMDRLKEGWGWQIGRWVGVGFCLVDGLGVMIHWVAWCCFLVGGQV